MRRIFSIKIESLLFLQILLETSEQLKKKWNFEIAKIKGIKSNSNTLQKAESLSS